MHDCPDCGMACDCDGEDHEQPTPDDCIGCGCEEDGEELRDDYEDETDA